MFYPAPGSPYAEAEEAKARSLFEQVAADEAILQCELLSGEIALVKGLQRTGLLRLTVGLERMLHAGNLLSYLDFGLRECRFLKQLGLHGACRDIINQVREQVGKVIKYSPRLHKELLRLGQ